MTQKRRFRFEYHPATVRQGEGCVAALHEELEREGCTRSLVVAGKTVGTTPEVMDPIRSGLDEAFVETFAETTPAKRLKTAIEGKKLVADTDADALIAVGGGSSIDVAKAIQFLVSAERSSKDLLEEFHRTGTINPPTNPLLPLFVIPTTLAGADLSMMAGITARRKSGVTSGGIADRRLMPTTVFYDPEIVRTTPREVLTGSAMNGFDKGLESLYASTRTPVTDATAMRGLEYLHTELPTLAKDPSAWNLEDILTGVMLVQYGISREEGTTLSLIHAFGHGLKAHSSVQQGIAHAIMAPHVLDFLFDRVDGRRNLLARALDVDTDQSRDAIADDVVAAVRDLRDGLSLATRLRTIDDLARSDLEAVATTTLEDSLLANAPAGLDVSHSDLEQLLETAW